MDSEAVDRLPPVIRILLDEDLTPLWEPSTARRYLRRMRPELSRQAEWTLSNPVYVDDERTPRPPGFVVTASGTLNPLNHWGVCRNLGCRLDAAAHFARTLGLYADVVTIPDVLTAEMLLDPSSQDYDDEAVGADMLVIKALEPLIRAGVVRFRSAVRMYCPGCSAELEQRVSQAVLDLLPRIQDELEFSEADGDIVIDMGKLRFDEGVTIVPLSRKLRRQIASGRTIREVGSTEFACAIHDALWNTLTDMDSAADLGSALFSSSRLDLLSIRALEATLPRMDDLEIWEDERSVALPWVRELSIGQVAELRDAAGQALPQLRETMLRTLAQQDLSCSASLLAELRAGAVDLAVELRCLNAGGEHRYRTVFGALGITISVYGFAAGFLGAGTALTGLLSLLGLLHTSSHKDEQEVKRLQSRPAYVLLRAKQMVERGRHAH